MTAKMAKPDKPAEREPLPDLTREAFLAADDRKPQRVEVPAIGGAVYVRVMSGEEAGAWETKVKELKGKDGPTVIAHLLVATVCDAQGNQLFMPGDVADLRCKAFTTLVALVNKAKRVNALDDSDIEELAKN